MTSNGSAAASRRILLVEDEMLVAMLMEDMLHDLGHEIIGIAARVDEAVKLCSESSFDAAILDVHLNGQDVFPVAELLARRKIPFAFATGYGARGLPEAYRHCRTLQKPFQRADVEALLGHLLAT